MEHGKHTPGPWVVKFQPRKWETMSYTGTYWYDQWVIKGPDKKHSPVAMVRFQGSGMGPSRAVRKANADLIAAAPDLLAALEFVLPCLMDVNASHPQALSDDELAQIKRTIAKAKAKP